MSYADCSPKVLAADNRRAWLPALHAAAHFHDLRHIGNNLTAANAGANPRKCTGSRQ